MIRLGIIGAGHWGPNLISNFSKSGRSEVRYVVDLDAERRAAVLDRFPEVQTGAEIDPILEDDALDGVVISTPTQTHYDLARRALKAGKHVLVEKPLSLSKADSQEMYDAAAAAGVMCQEGMWSRYFPAAEHARHLIESGAIGEVRMLQADMGGLMMNQDPEDMVTKREFHNSMLSCYAVQSIGLAYPGVQPTKISAAGHKPDG